MYCPIKIIRITDSAELERAFLVRLEVFVREQNVPIEFEIDDLDSDPSTVHVLALRTDTVPHLPVGTARLLVDADQSGILHIGRVAVLKETRGSAVGTQLMTALEDIASQEYAVDGKVVIELSAQEEALGFYNRLGYQLFDDNRYLDCNIWHRDARKVITVTHS